MIKILCLIAAVVGVANAIVCPPDICWRMMCAQVTADNCNGVVKKNGGYCGCCDACVTELAEGKQCRATVLLGEAPTVTCGDGLYCNKHTSTCEKITTKRDVDLTPCATELAAVTARKEAEPHLMGLEDPHCLSDGTYDGIQYRGSQAFCVTSNGTMIDGYMLYRWLPGKDTSCQCARDQYVYQQTGMIGKMFFCNLDGSYAPVGCTGSVCYCQDSKGKQVGTSTVGIWKKDSMNC